MLENDLLWKLPGNRHVFGDRCIVVGHPMEISRNSTLAAKSAPSAEMISAQGFDGQGPQPLLCQPGKRCRVHH
jgi:hypothetical protein